MSAHLLVGRDWAQDMVNENMQLREENARYRDSLARAAAQIDAYRAVVVPLNEHERALTQRDTALANVDALTREIARLRDVASTVKNEALVASLRALVRQLDRIHGYSTHADQQELREARALLVEARL